MPRNLNPADRFGFLNRSWARRTGRVASLAGLLVASSCAGNRSLAKRTPIQPPVAGKATSVAENTPAQKLPSYADKLAQAKQASPSPVPTSEPQTEPTIEHAVVEGKPLVASVEQLSHETVSEDSSKKNEGKATVHESGPRPWAEDLNGAPTLPKFNEAAIAAAVYHPAEPKVALPAAACPAPGCQPGAANGTDPCCIQETGADEYICDGGDNGQPVHYESGRIAGLEAEDTVVEYRDEKGRRRVKESSQVCVYAPRFGVARSVTEAVSDYNVDKIAGAHDGRTAAGYSHEMVVDEKQKIDAIVDMRARDRLSGLASAQSEGFVAEDVAPVTHAKLINAFQDYSFLRTGQLDIREAALFEKLVNAAGEWSYKFEPRVTADAVGGQTLTAKFKAEEAVAVNDQRGPGELRIVKLADREAASPGDVITFSIRVDNLGGRELREIRVMDCLSPRLELIESSVTCEQPGKGSLDGELALSEGDSGGTMLEFRLADPLQGQTGAVITFECRVR